MTDPNILDRIDETLEDYDQWDGHSPDAARWDGDEWVDERRVEWRDPAPRSLINVNGAAGRLYMVDAENPDAPTMAELENATELTNLVRLHYGEPSDFTFPQRVVVGIDPASQYTHITVVPETLGAAWRLITEAAIEFAIECHAIKRQTEASTGKSWAYLVQRAERPMAAAERTRSPRRRAGSRRNKRHARRRQ